MKVKEELKHVADLEFFEEKHYYRVKGKYIPSVSSILKPISKQIYGEIDEEILKKAQERGTEVHLAIEIFNETGAEVISEEYAGYFQAYKAFRQAYPHVEVIASEYRMYEPSLWYAGTADLIMRDTGSDELLLVDTKTSVNIEYAALIPQLTAYERALNVQNVPVQKSYVLHLKKDGTFVFEQIKPDMDVFISCLTIQKFIDKHKRRY